MYGHFDKQPHLKKENWTKGGPIDPIIENGKMYGRGGADDGYSIYLAISTIKIL